MSGKRVLIAIAAIAVVVVVIGAVIVASTSTPAPVTHEKQVALSRLVRFDDAVVVAAGADLDRVRSTLDHADMVSQYAALPVGTLAGALKGSLTSDAKSVFARVCNEPSTRTFAVQVDRRVPHDIGRLAALLGSSATAIILGKPDVDAEVFMKVDAPAAQVDAVHRRIAADHDVSSDKYIDHDAALAAFRKLFAGQTKLIRSETAADLPESFQLEVGRGASVDRVAARYRDLPGVDQVNTPGRDTQPDDETTLPPGQAEIFMQVALADADAKIAAVSAQLRADARVSSYSFTDHADAYAEFKLLFSDDPDNKVLIENETPSSLPTSFDVVLRDQQDAAAFQQQYASVPGVDTVRISRSTLEDACAPEP